MARGAFLIMDTLPPTFWLGVVTGVVFSAILVVGFFALTLNCRRHPESPTWEQLLKDQE